MEKNQILRQNFSHTQLVSEGVQLKFYFPQFRGDDYFFLLMLFFFLFYESNTITYFTLCQAHNLVSKIHLLHLTFTNITWILTALALHFTVGRAEAWRFGILLELYSSCTREPEWDLSLWDQVFAWRAVLHDLLSRVHCTAH